MTTIDHLVQPGELLTSPELIKRVTDEGYSYDHARKIIQKHSQKGTIKRSKNFALPRNARLFWHGDYSGTEEFQNRVFPLLEKSRPGLARVSKALAIHSVLLRPHVQLLLACPHDLKKYPSYRKEVAALEELGVAKCDGGSGVLERVVSPTIARTPKSHALGIKARSALIVQNAISGILVKHFRRTNLISWNTVPPQTDTELSVFNNFYFSASGFSWVKPMLKVRPGTKPKPTPVVFDVWPYQCTTTEVESFLERIQRAGQNTVSKLNFLGIIAAVGFNEDAWRMAKEAGLMTINLRQFFGDAALDALAQVETLLNNIGGDPGQADEKDFAQYAKTLEALKTNPYVVDLRSIGFEALSALLLRSDGWENVLMNLQVPFSENGQREVDVCGHKQSGDQLYVVECKAEAADKMLSTDYVVKFFTETVPAYIKHSCGNRMPARCTAEIWTTGQVGSDATAALEQIRLKPFIKPALLSNTEVVAKIPRGLESCKRLITAISVC